MFCKEKKKEDLETPGIDPGTSRMQSERSSIWATPPLLVDFYPSIIIDRIVANPNSR